MQVSTGDLNATECVILVSNHVILNFSIYYYTSSIYLFIFEHIVFHVFLSFIYF